MSKKSLAPFFKITVSSLLLSWLIYSFDWIALCNVLLAAEPAWLVLAGVFVVISMVVSVEKWSRILRAEGINLSWLYLWKVYWIGIFFNNFLPSSIGGDGMRILLTGRNINNVAGMASSVIIERLLATVGLALTGLLMVPITKYNRYIGWLFIVLITAAAGLLFFLMSGRIPAWAARSNGKIGGFVRGFLMHGHALRGQKKMVVTVLFLSVLFQLTVVAVNYAIFRGLHVDFLTWWDLVYIIPAISAISMVPLGINGYGIREGAYVLLLSSYGVAGSAALGASLLYAVLVSFCSLYGGILWFSNRGAGADGAENAGKEFSLT